jgi:hypothetical protein
MAGNVTTLDLNKSLLLKGLSLPNKMAMVYAQDYGYNVLTQLSSKLGPSISTPQAKVEISSLGNLSVFSVVSAVAAGATGELLVTVSNSENFRPGDIIADSNLVQGIVIEKTATANQLRVKSVTTTLSSSLHFLTGHVAKVMFDASANRLSYGKPSLNVVPNTDFTYTAVTRESSTQARRDRVSSFVKWQGDFWYRSYDDLTLRRFAKTLEYKYAFSERGTFGGPNGETYSTAGLRWSIINNGGTYLPLTSELTQTAFNDFLETLVRKSADNGRRLVAMMGSAAMARLQTILGDYIKYAGTQNTLGGVAVEGLNVMTYAYAGISIEFVRWALLDDEMFRAELSSVTGKPKQSHSIYLLDMTPLPAADGSGSLSPLQKYHFNNDEMIANYVPGMIGLEGSDPSSIKQTIAGSQLVSLGTNDVDGVDFHVLSDCGLYCAADKMGLIELVL